MHAYSVMKAVEMDGQRLVLLKNPWGKGEWKGAWSDGSKEWTPEWLQKLKHTFGDDGAFWISYHDLLKKYNIFDVTRLFGPEWKVTSIWTTLSVPWTLDYHETYFAFTISKSGPVVIVLAQLDDRYFRGLEGQYRFDLQFRLHKAGQEDYVVRSQASYRMNRSVNVELDLQAGSYEVLVKLDAVRNDGVLPIDQVIRNNAKNRREKLIRIGLAYDLAHSKGKLVELPAEKSAKQAHEKRQREKRRADIKRKILEEREQEHYLRIKAKKKAQKQQAKRIAQHQAAKEKLRAQKKIAHLPPSKQSEPIPNPPIPVAKVIIQEDKPEALEIATKNLSLSKDSRGMSSQTNSGTAVAEDVPVSPRHKDRAIPQILNSAGMLEQNSRRGPGFLTPPKATNKDSRGDRRVIVSVRSEVQETTLQDDEEVMSEAAPPSEYSAPYLCESDDDGIASVSSMSELSERELELEIDAVEKREPITDRLPPQPAPGAPAEEQDEFERDPWNAVAVVGLRVYSKVSDEDQEEVIGNLRVVRPSLYPQEEALPQTSELGDKKSKGLDVDDSAKDATLEGEIKQRKKSIRPTSEDLSDASKLSRSDAGRKRRAIPSADSLGYTFDFQA
ncbi:calpain family cysteine protease [Colletotrichum salicis]|uniref:Calpain family cysteine protease n=1 Tax=Colletotrichum salicis TaxID=1209931 RepID=A0A135UGB6_9PEZI|nr:calpain family cysteine protease [Colletotrichum salicis]